MKKVFYSSLALLVLVLIFLGAYNFAFKDNPSNPKTGESRQVLESGEKPGEAAPATSLVSPLNEEVLGLAVGPGKHLTYYSLGTQAFKRSSFEGKDKETLLSNLPGVPERIVWGPKQDKALCLLRLPDGPARWHLADLSTKSLIPLKPEITRVSWNHLGDKIFYLYTDTRGTRTLNTSNPDGSEWKEIARLGEADRFLSAIPQSTGVAFWNRPNALESSTLESMGAAGDERKTLLQGRYGADYLWSPTGKHILVSTSTEQGGSGLMLNLMNQNGGELRSLNIPTLASKVVWSEEGQYLYYALPGGLTNATLPNDYFEKPLYSQDTFWRVDIETGKSTRLVDPQEIGQSFDSTNLELSPEEDALFFIDRVTKRPYRIDL